MKYDINPLGSSETKLKCWSRFVAVLDAIYDFFEMDIDHANLSVITLKVDWLLNA